MRVLAICHEDPEHLLGGMGRHCRELYRFMAKRSDVEIDFLTSGPGEGCKDYLGYRKHQSSKLVCYKSRTVDMSTHLMADWQLAKTLTKLLAEGRRWDLVHIHEWGSVQLGHMASQALGVPLVGTMHLCITKLVEVEQPDCYKDADKWPEEEHYLRNQEGRLVEDPDRFICCSRAYERILRETFLTQRRIDVIHNGIDTEFWKPMFSIETSHAHLREKGRLTALYVGRIATMKGIVPLLDAVEREDLGWKVVLTGEVNANTVEEREAWDVTQRIRRLQETYPERLVWTGFEHGRSLRHAYESAHCVIMPSIHEPFGIVALEAMAMGRPLICTEVDGLREIVVDEEDKEYALIIPPNSADAIAEGLRMLVDWEVREKLQLLGFRRVYDFTWDEAVDKTLEVYREALQWSGKRAKAG